MCQEPGFHHRGQSPPTCAPVALSLTQHRLPAVETCHCITASLVSFQEIFAFMNKKNLRQYIYKVTFHLFLNSNMLF